LAFQDNSPTEILLEVGTMSYGVIPLGSKQTDMLNLTHQLMHYYIQ